MVLNYTVGVCNWMTERDRTGQDGTEVKEEELIKCDVKGQSEAAVVEDADNDYMIRRYENTNKCKSPVTSRYCSVTTKLSG